MKATLFTCSLNANFLNPYKAKRIPNISRIIPAGIKENSKRLTSAPIKSLFESMSHLISNVPISQWGSVITFSEFFFCLSLITLLTSIQILQKIMCEIPTENQRAFPVKAILSQLPIICNQDKGSGKSVRYRLSRRRRTIRTFNELLIVRILSIQSQPQLQAP